MRGFTLIELIVVITIIGILAAAVAFNAPGWILRAKKKRAEADIVNLEKAASAYGMDRNGNLPESLEQLADPDKEDRLLTEIPLDPWGQPYEYRKEGSRPWIGSLGPSPDDPSDDITSETIREARKSQGQ